MIRRTLMLALMLAAASCPATWAGNLSAAQVTPMMAQLRTESAPLEQQVANLQKQVSVLQAQMNALLSAVKVTEAGVVVQGPTVTIAGGTIAMKSNASLTIEADSLRAVVQHATTLNSGQATTISSSAAIVQATGPVDIKGSLVRFNNGSKGVATQGTLVHMAPNGNGQIINGSTTVFAD